VIDHFGDRIKLMVGEHSTQLRRRTERAGLYGPRERGASGKDFVGISSDNDCGNQSGRKPKVSCVKFVCAGLVGP
jgi:hypothetical protein